MLWGTPGFRNEIGDVERITWFIKYFPAFLPTILKAFAENFPDLSSYSHRVCSIANTNSFTGIDDLMSTHTWWFYGVRLAGFHCKYPGYWHRQRSWHETMSDWEANERRWRSDTVTAKRMFLATIHFVNGNFDGLQFWPASCSPSMASRAHSLAWCGL